MTGRTGAHEEDEYGRADEQRVRISREFGHEMATARQARAVGKIGMFYDTVEHTPLANSFAPNRNGGHQGFLRKAV